MEENAFDKLKSMLNNSNIPDELKNIMSNINSSNKSDSSSSQNNGISPEAISNLMSMLNSNKKRAEASPAPTKSQSEPEQRNDGGARPYR